ncbi:H2A super protein [Malassezia sp. CBS 17886]|nr:H2A super protein [Malassezia sp. CBS 17886]
MVKRSAASKFPIARIKRIMQADEDVGKVAQATPVVISKALELFMQDIVACSVEHTRKSGGKRMAPYHLKRATQTNETFDFLKDIVERVQDPLESGTGPKGGKRRKIARPVSEAEKDKDEGVEKRG